MRPLFRFALPFLAVAGSGSLEAQGTPSGSIGFYNGDCQQGIPGVANWYTSAALFRRVYDRFTVPSGGWTVGSVFSHSVTSINGITLAAWEIRSGLSAGNPGTVVASGLSPATQTLRLTWPDGEQIARIEVDGLNVPLASGAYWLNVSPVIDSTPGYVCATLGVNAQGAVSASQATSFLHDPVTLFQPIQTVGNAGTSTVFSQGLLLYSGPPPAVPVISAIVNSASWRAGAISPGELVTIAGTSLGPAASATLVLDENGHVSRNLDAVAVSFNSTPSPEIYVGTGQINAIVPYELAGASQASVVVTAAGQGSASFPIAIAAASPALFAADGSGAGQGAILNQDLSYNSASNPAAKGSYIVLYVTGEGQTSPAGVSGAITLAGSTVPYTPQPQLPVSVSIAGMPTQIAFYGEAPGLVAGVMQVNVQVPPTAPSGNAPVVVSVGSFSSPSGITVALR
jgi:uncharacterized protein (TIGR03437 family)